MRDRIIGFRIYLQQRIHHLFQSGLKMTQAILVLMGGLCVVGCSNENKRSSEMEKFQVTSPVLMDTVFVREYVAEIHSIQNIELRARVSGFIEKIHIDEGEKVKAGQVLFTISSQGFREELLKANAFLKSANAEFKVAEVERKNIKKLVENNIVSASELEMAEAELEAIQARIEEAKSTVSSAQLNLAFTEVKAPFSGIINRIPNKAGSLTEEGALLTSLSNNEAVFAYFNMSELEYLEFTKQKDSERNKRVSLVMADNQLYKQQGIIETVESEIDRNTGTIAFRARFQNPDELLKHGSSGKILLTTKLTNAILVPQKSTFEIQENLYVYTVTSDNVVELRKIIPKLRLPHLYVIQSGVNADDKIIYEGIQRVKAGDKIVTESVSDDLEIFRLTHK